MTKLSLTLRNPYSVYAALWMPGFYQRYHRDLDSWGYWRVLGTKINVIFVVDSKREILSMTPFETKYFWFGRKEDVR